MEEITLPEEWVWATLGSLGEYINGYAFNEKYWSKVGRPIIRIQDLTGTGKSPNFYEGEIDKKYLVHYGDFLIAWSATLGAFIWNGSEAWLNQHIFKVNSYIDKLFHYYLVQSVVDDLYAQAHGSGMVHVTRGKFETIKVAIPPLAEQQRIVAAIEQQFTRLDAGVAALKSAQTRLKRYRAAVLKAAVEGKLTEAWRSEHPTSEPASQLLERILQERRAKWEADLRAKGKDPVKVKYVEPAAPNMSELPELPEGWCWATVEQVSQIQGGLQKQPSRTPQKNAYPYLRVANVLRGHLDLSVIEKMELFGDELTALSLKAGDLLIVEGNGSRTEIGRSALWNGEIDDCVHQNHIIRVRLIIANSKYLNIYWNSPLGSKHVTDVAGSTSGLYTLSVGKISRLPVPLCPLEEQQQIVSEVERRLSVVSKLEAMVEANLKRAERLRQSILKEAFAGRLVEQDPDDEPASVLLERIRKEREEREVQQGRGERKGRKQSKVQQSNGYKHPSSEQGNVQAVSMMDGIQAPEHIEVDEVEQIALWSAD